MNFFANNPETPELEKSRAKEALEDFSNVHIQTFDSYCKGIVSQASNSYGIRPDFSVGEGDSESDIKKQALPFVFENRNSAGIKTFASVGRYQDFADKILSSTIINNTSIITPSDFFVKKLELQKKEVIEAWNFLLLGETAKTNPCPSSLRDAYNEYLEETDKGVKVNLGATNLSSALLTFSSAFNDCSATDHDVYIKAQKSYDAQSSLCLLISILKIQIQMWWKKSTGFLKFSGNFQNSPCLPQALLKTCALRLSLCVKKTAIRTAFYRLTLFPSQTTSRISFQSNP